MTTVMVRLVHGETRARMGEGVRLLTEERLSQRAAAERMGLSLSVFHRAMKPILDGLVDDAKEAASRLDNV